MLEPIFPVRPIESLVSKRLYQGIEKKCHGASRIRVPRFITDHVKTRSNTPYTSIPALGFTYKSRMWPEIAPKVQQVQRFYLEWIFLQSTFTYVWLIVSYSYDY